MAWMDSNVMAHSAAIQTMAEPMAPIEDVMRILSTMDTMAPQKALRSTMLSSWVAMSAW